MLTLPNLLTLSRIVAVPLLAWLLWLPSWHAGYALAFALYCLMGITDYFDGYVARARGTVSKLGVFLDPIADKIMVAAVILLLVGTRDGAPPVIAGFNQIAALVILLREIDNQSYEDITRITESSVATVKTRLFRAREKLKLRLAEFR